MQQQLKFNQLYRQRLADPLTQKLFSKIIQNRNHICDYCGYQNIYCSVHVKKITTEFPENELEANLAVLCHSCTIITTLELSPLESFLFDLLNDSYKHININPAIRSTLISIIKAKCLVR